MTAAHLYSHQIDGAQWLADRALTIGGGYLADDMGLGKTRTLLHTITLLKARRPVVICPAIVRTHWLRESELLGVPLLHVMSYEGAVAGGMKLQVELSPDLLISDEAHYCKSMDALRTRRVFGLGGYARGARYVLPASGTPMPKNPLELWPVLACFPSVCKEHKLFNRRDYVQRFCAVRLIRLGRRSVTKVMPELRNEAEFNELLSKVMLRRYAADVGLDVPPLDWLLMPLDLDVPDLQGVSLGGAAAAEWRHYVGEQKAPRVADMLAEQLHNSSQKVVVFAHHRSVLNILREKLLPFGVSYIDGDTSPKMRDGAIDRFQTDPNVRVFIGQNLACMTGITLTAANRCVLVEPDWTADVNHQLGRRIARIGQTEHCTAHMVTAADTIDDAILRTNQAEIRLAEKAGLTNAV